jgi:hypothetical protein
VSASWTQKSRSEDQECVAVFFNLQKLPLGSANMDAKKKRKKREKRERCQDAN